jgi:hypothetical protein
MREIINVHLGLCGNNVGLNFFENIAQEHGVN